MHLTHCPDTPLKKKKKKKIPANNPEIVLQEDPRNNSALYGHFLVPVLIQWDETWSGCFSASLRWVNEPFNVRRTSQWPREMFNCRHSTGPKGCGGRPLFSPKKGHISPTETSREGSWAPGPQGIPGVINDLLELCQRGWTTGCF